MSAGAKGAVVCNTPQGPPPLSRLKGNGPAQAWAPGFEHRAGHARGASFCNEIRPRRVPPLLRAVRLRFTNGQGLSVNTTTKLLSFTPSSNQFWTNQNLLMRFNVNGGLTDNISGIGIGLQIKLADTSLTLSSLGLSTTFNCVGLKPNNGLSIDAVTKLLQYNLNPDYYNIMEVINYHQY